MGSEDKIQIVWFKRDLRIEDHRALVSAARSGPVLPLFIVEPELWQAPDMSARQWAFVCECLNSLRESLAELGQPLIVRIGDALEILERAHQRYGQIKLWSHEETGNGWTYARDKNVARWASANGTEWEEIRQTGVVRRLTSRDGWAKRWDTFIENGEKNLVTPQRRKNAPTVQASISVTSCPRAFAASAASTPMGPAPITKVRISPRGRAGCRPEPSGR